MQAFAAPAPTSRESRGGAPDPPRNRLARRLALTTLLPVTLGIFAFGIFAERHAQTMLEDELGRRLALSALAVSVQVLPEQIAALQAGDETSRTFANVKSKLLASQARFGLRRVMILGVDFVGRGDSLGRVSLGAKAYEVSADDLEFRQAWKGRPTASPLFTGHDGRPYKRAYAAVGVGSAVVGVVMVEGNATYYEPLLRFRRWLVICGCLLLVVLIAAVVMIGQRITGPVGRLALAADRIGRGELAAPIAIETKDEIGVLAERFEQMRQALAARDERMQMMLAGIAHEVRNPLGGLQLFVGLLREGLHGQPERLDEVKSLQREVTYLDAVVAEFLDYARRPSLDLQNVQLLTLLQEVKLAAGQHTDVIEVVADPSLRVSVDKGQFRRVLLNLVQNALQAAPQAPVVMAAGLAANSVFVEVRDAGPGVPNEIKESIFAPFFTTRQKGTGLGLAFAREIVAEHHGTLTVHTAPEGGACFRITL